MKQWSLVGFGNKVNSVSSSKTSTRLFGAGSLKPLSCRMKLIPPLFSPYTMSGFPSFERSATLKRKFFAFTFKVSRPVKVPAKFPSMFPMFESLGGIDAVGKMLYAGTAPPEVESVLVKILNIQSEREEEVNEMEMDEEMKPLSAVFGMLDENGRLW